MVILPVEAKSRLRPYVVERLRRSSPYQKHSVR